MLIPIVKTHFTFEMKFMSDDKSDIFFKSWTENDAEIKMLEIGQEQYTIYTFEK